MSARRRSIRSLVKKCVFAIAVTVAFFSLIELGLWICGVDVVASTRDPFAGFAQIPLFSQVTTGSGEELLTTADSKLVWFNSQTFAKQKPRGTRRVFCVGGSTTYGRPYWDGTSYSAWLRELLPLVDSNSDWEVINAGGVSYASYRVAAVMEELAEFEPDLFVVYSSHNEFLERRTYGDMFAKSNLQLQLASVLSRTRTWALLDRNLNSNGHAEDFPVAELPPDEVDEILNHTVGPSDYHRDSKWTSDVLRHYELNLERMVSIARQSGAKIVFVTPASNAKDSSPFKSEPLRRLSDGELIELENHLAIAKSLLREELYDNALSELESARSIDDGLAEVQYYRGKALFGAGRFDEAHEAFVTAVVNDFCPLRALPEITASIHRVAIREQVPVVEFGELLTGKCEAELGHRCLGDEYFLDHVHPTIEVHQQLASWIIDTLQAERIASGTSPTNDMLLEVTDRIEQRIDWTAQGVAMRNLAKLMHWSGKFDEAARCAADALELIDGDLESQFLLAECLRQVGDSDQAMQEFELLFQLAPNYDRGYIPFGMLLVDEGHLTAAKIYLSMAVALYPNRDDAFFALGQAHFQGGEYRLAFEAFTEASLINPADTTIRDSLAQTRAAIAVSSNTSSSRP